ncbi:TetR/AcrR family transcriptional regulator [Pseudonocardia humida]|uniref:Helix-turn-helix transcriptional regulator n=1 Tax=Pseudonocardia humida TaxID=2800819 RepID=A0ABT0ZW97_9PSEU|nr:TetR/AcrR family transcriptional regulator [Pseudonocardia humida]MCO1654950.1 helix-turn-helix transcriptional regulator [Pseudonocardia humida]
MTGSPAARPQRADARRNRDRIVEVAAAVVAEQGAGASLEEIARRAGVGSATLHRHFATRQALLQAVFAGHVDALCATADALLAEPDPAGALVAWLRAVLVHAVAHRGLAAALLADVADPASLAAFHHRIETAGEALLDRARSAGVVRAGLVADELLQLTGAIAASTEGRPGARARAERLLGVVVDGIRVAPA